MAGCESRNQWDQHSAAVRSLFTPIELDGQKLLSQKKLVHDWDRLSKVRLARAEAGRKGGLAKSEANHQDDDSVKANGTEAKATEGKATEEKPTEPNLTNRSEVREVTCLPIASNSPAIARLVENAGGMDGISSANGRSSAIAADSGPKGSGQEKLSGWKSEFQLKVQTAAAEHDDTSIVFSVPLPAKVFRWVEQMADRCGMAEAQDAVIEWLEARSFNGLANPNVVWDKMEDEILPFVPENQRVLQTGKA